MLPHPPQIVALEFVPAMATPFGLLVMEDFLRELSGKEFFYSPNVGNAGDSLIAAGTYQMFRRLGLQPTMLRESSDVDRSTVVIGGGGNLVPLYAETRAVLERVIGRADRIIILPHTIQGNEDLLQRLPANATVFCREPVSYQHVLANTAAQVFLDHDMAFQLDVASFDEWCRRYTDAPKLFEQRLAELDAAIDPDTGEGRFLRRDGERHASSPDLEGSCDLSTMFEFGTWPDNAEKSVFCVFEAIRRTHRVVTDRLHMTIASGLLGKPVTMLDNSYGKNRNVYLHSIKRFCPSVAFSID